MTTPVRITVFGATGRMGRALVALIATDGSSRLAGANGSPTSAKVDRDVGEIAGLPPLGVALCRDPAVALIHSDVAIDVSLPVACAANLAACEASGTPIVVGATGHDADVQSLFARAARRIPVLVAPNMSLGVNVLLDLAERAARLLGAAYDAEICEAHHRDKRDAPSGTALALGEAVAHGRGVDFRSVATYARHGATGVRPAGSIGFSVVRGGDIVGEHVLTLAGPGERLELAHRASDRSTFARGGLLAAHWLVGRAPGRYTMRDVLGL